MINEFIVFPPSSNRPKEIIPFSNTLPSGGMCTRFAMLMLGINERVQAIRCARLAFAMNRRRQGCIQRIDNDGRRRMSATVAEVARCKTPCWPLVCQKSKNSERRSRMPPIVWPGWQGCQSDRHRHEAGTTGIRLLVSGFR